MSWLEFLQGFPMIFFRTEGAVILWASRGAPFWQSFLFSVFWTSLIMVITYYGAGVIVEKLKKWWVLKILIEKWQKEILLRKNNFQKEESAFSKKTRGWLSLRKRWVIFLLAFVPYTHIIPGLGSAIIVTARLLKLRYGLIILFVGNLFRWTIIIYHIYQGVQYLQNSM